MEYILPLGTGSSGRSSMAQSHGLWGGNLEARFGQKTSLKWAYSFGMSMERFSRGLSMDVELTGIIGTDEMGLGRLGKHPGKHSLPRFRTSPVDHEMEGLWEMSQGRPRMIPAVDFSRTNRQMFFMCSWPNRSWMGPTQCRTCPRPRGLPVIDWILYRMSLSLFLSWSWWHKSAEMKLPADPESRRAWTEIQWRGVVSCTIVVSGCILTEEEETTLTTGRWGRTGHVLITCPFWPQYRHNPWVSQRRRSAEDSRVLSTCMGSYCGSGGLGNSGWRNETGGFWHWLSSIQPWSRFATRMESSIKHSSPMVSS